MRSRLNHVEASEIRLNIGHSGGHIPANYTLSPGISQLSGGFILGPCQNRLVSFMTRPRC